MGYLQQLDTRPGHNLPVSEMYFLGGINTVRGYLLRSIAPTTITGTSTRPDAPTQEFPIGGGEQFFVNVDVEFPTFLKVGIRGEVFADAGNVFAVDSKFFQDKLYN